MGGHGKAPEGGSLQISGLGRQRSDLLLCMCFKRHEDLWNGWKNCSCCRAFWLRDVLLRPRAPSKAQIDLAWFYVAHSLNDQEVRSPVSCGPCSAVSSACMYPIDISRARCRLAQHHQRASACMHECRAHDLGWVLRSHFGEASAPVTTSMFLRKGKYVQRLGAGLCPSPLSWNTWQVLIETQGRAMET